MFTYWAVDSSFPPVKLLNLTGMVAVEEEEELY